ncbi:MAG: CcmE/CycJ protein [Dehalococcoidia bacterium]|nr:CcmE/CycJ protein [Dehalococcoidia bacterium]
MNQPQPTARPEPLSERSFIARRGKILMGAGVLILALGYLGFTAFQSATAYYLTVSELKAKGPAIYEKNVRVSGELVPSSFERDPNGTVIRFSLTDGLLTLDAVYEGPVPDLFFNEESQILLEGTYGADGLFDAQSIIVKCPSKYEPVSTSTPEAR